MLCLTTPHPAYCPMQQPRKRCCFFCSLSAGSDEAARWQRGFRGVSNRRGEEQAVNSFLENKVSGECFIWWVGSRRAREKNKKKCRCGQGHRGGPWGESQMISILLILHVCSFAECTINTEGEMTWTKQKCLQSHVKGHRSPLVRLDKISLSWPWHSDF